MGIHGGEGIQGHHCRTGGNRVAGRNAATRGNRNPGKIHNAEVGKVARPGKLANKQTIIIIIIN